MTSLIQLGTTYGSLAALDAMTTPVNDPSSFLFYPYSELVRTGAGTSIGRGGSYAVLGWKGITRAQRDQLRTLCPGASASIYCKLPTNENNLTVGTFTGIMTWPLEEPYFLNIISDFKVIIYNLETYSPPA